MSYGEEKIFKATVIVKYAEEGFKASARKVGQMLAETEFLEDIEDVPDLLKSLLLEYEALKEVREDLERAKKFYLQMECGVDDNEKS
jgi:NifU-like protein involved in Fe-S cluster formation